MIRELIPQFDQLTDSEKLLLVEELWDDLTTRPDQIALTDAQKAELDRRYEEFKKNPTEGSSWEEVKARIRRSL